MASPFVGRRATGCATTIGRRRGIVLRTGLLGAAILLAPAALAQTIDPGQCPLSPTQIDELQEIVENVVCSAGVGNCTHLLGYAVSRLSELAGPQSPEVRDCVRILHVGFGMLADRIGQRLIYDSGFTIGVDIPKPVENAPYSAILQDFVTTPVMAALVVAPDNTDGDNRGEGVTAGLASADILVGRWLYTRSVDLATGEVWNGAPLPGNPTAFLEFRADGTYSSVVNGETWVTNTWQFDPSSGVLSTPDDAMLLEWTDSAFDGITFSTDTHAFTLRRM
ncbi:MAG: hypothetical protein RLO50_17215 [Azospirillaceae bacterium]